MKTLFDGWHKIALGILAVSYAIAIINVSMKTPSVELVQQAGYMLLGGLAIVGGWAKLPEILSGIVPAIAGRITGKGPENPSDK